MIYKNRLLETKLKNLGQHFPVVVLTGARQVGKTTLLKHLLREIRPHDCLAYSEDSRLVGHNGAPLTTKPSIHYTFDPITDIGNARQDPELFLDHIGTPVLLDEIQYTPELLPAIKRRVDATLEKVSDRPPCQYWITGSQNLSVAKNIAESLAGRAATLSLYPMSLGEAFNHPSSWIINFLNDPQNFLRTPQLRLFAEKPVSVYDILWRGTYPGLLETTNEILQAGLESYLHTYVERDVRLAGDISDLHEFSRFVRLLANLTAQEINYSQLGREIGVTPQTAQRWLNLLINTFQWHEVDAYSGNTIKRISSKKKGYFMDTGMACHLMHITSANALSGHPRAGALFETFVVLDIFKQLALMPTMPAVYHWREHGSSKDTSTEVDLVLELDNRYFPIEIKLNSHPSKFDARGIAKFRKTYPALQIEAGLIIAPVAEIFPLDDNCYVVPWDLV